MTARTTRRIALCVALLATPGLAACGDDDEATVAEWTKAANSVCADINAARAEAATDAFPTGDEKVTAEHLQAFYDTFEPDFRAAIEQIGELDRPAKITDEIEDFVTAGRELANYMAAASADDTIAENDLAADGDTEAHRDFEQAGPNLDLTVCEEG